VGRFISEDPIGFAGRDVNFYTYAHNQPTLWVDPLGLAVVKVPTQAEYNALLNDIGLGSLPDLMKDAMYAIYMDPIPIVAGEPINCGRSGTRSLGKVLFGKGGLLNSNRYLRIGYGRIGGHWTFRISGDLVKRLPRFLQERGHIILKDLGKIKPQG
jgi:uncharacterized protein RhaS with RHS repeats